MSATQTKKGFTIIEVVLVLAIAGLIFLMVFVALPALQRGQHDNARKNDVSTVSAAVNSYTSNNRGAFPTTEQLETYLGTKTTLTATTFSYSELSDNTTSVTVNSAALPTSAAEGSIVVVARAKCNTVSPNGVVSLQTGTARQYAVITQLESGNKSGFCLDS